jgi:hypothetical protein
MQPRQVLNVTLGKATAITFALCLSLSQMAQGHLGETPEQCEQRYGKHVDEGTTEEGLKFRNYKKGDIELQVLFESTPDGKVGEAISVYYSCCNIKYEEQVNKLLEADSQGQKWTWTNAPEGDWIISATKSDGSISGKRKYVRADGQASAEYNIGLSVRSAKYD